MAFSWTNILAGGAIKAAHFNQVKNTVDSIISDTGLATFSWTKLPVSVGDAIEAGDANELRSAADYLHDAGALCSSDNSNHDTTVNPGHLSGHCLNVYSTDQNGYQNGVFVSRYGVDDSDLNSGALDAKNIGYDLGDYDGARGGHYMNDFHNNYGGHRGSDYGSDYGSYRGSDYSDCGAQYLSVDIGYQGSDYGAQPGAQYLEVLIGHQGSDYGARPGAQYLEVLIGG